MRAQRRLLAVIARLAAASLAVLVFAATWLATGMAAEPAADWARMRPQPPRFYECRRATETLVIDGRIDEQSWRNTPWTEPFVDIEGDRQAAPRLLTRAKMLWDDRYFYVAADMDEPHVWGTLRQRDSVIFQDNDFELFVDPDGDNHEYYEFEINALNTGWDLFLPKPYKDGGKADNSWDIAGLLTAVHVDGTLNNPGDTDRGWSVEIAIPWTAFNRARRAATPPAADEWWRVNFSRVEWRHQIVDGQYRKVPNTPENNWVWSPQGIIDMHRPERWGYVRFSQATASTPTAATSTAATTTAATTAPDSLAIAVRDALMTVYHHEKSYHARHGRWTDDLAALDFAPDAWKGLVAPPAIQLDANGFTATMSVPIRSAANRSAGSGSAPISSAGQGSAGQGSAGSGSPGSGSAKASDPKFDRWQVNQESRLWRVTADALDKNEPDKNEPDKNESDKNESDKDAAAIRGALERAGENRGQLERALRETPAEQQPGMRFLVAHMPASDLRRLTADYLLENVAIAYQSWRASPWHAQVPEDVFLNDILPYASVNERRDRWRRDFRDRCLPLIADAKTPGLAAARLNQKIFPLFKVRYSTKRAKADQSPYESIESGLASCTGLSLLLINACRAVGVPARFCGTPLWADNSGNHSWVEVWDDGWHFTGAAEPAGDKLDNVWFSDRASQARRDHPFHAIYASSFRRTPASFPMVWAMDNREVPAVNVTDRYVRRAAAVPEGSVRVRVRVADTDGERVAARVAITSPRGDAIFSGIAKDERFDRNDHLTAVLDAKTAVDLRAEFQGRSVTMRITAPAAEQLISMTLPPPPTKPASETQPATDKPAADKPATDKPAADKQTADKPAADKQAADKPATDKPAADKQTADKPATDKPAADKPAADKPAADKPAADKLATDKPAADKPAADKQTAENQTADNQADSGPAEPPAADLSAAAVSALEKFLTQDAATRGAIDAQSFAATPLTRADAERAEKLLWQAYAEGLRASRAEEITSNKLKRGEWEMPIHIRRLGEKPATGWSLYISLHGGGGTTPAVNDGQWNNQKRLYTPAEGLYVAPRAPTNTWNLWHQDHIDGLFDRLIESLIAIEGVDPDRVYLLGYSAGGDGVYQLAPRMADRFAAAAMMAGHPNETSPLGLRNLPFAIYMGGLDAAYNRNKTAADWRTQLEKLREQDPQGYPHLVTIYPDKGHWMGREDAAAIPWLARQTRDPLPRKIVWKQDDVTHSRFYWLAVDAGEHRERAEVFASREGQRIDVRSDSVARLRVRLNDKMLDLDRPVVITRAGKPLLTKRISRSIATLQRTIAERGDPRSVFSSELVVAIAGQSTDR
jgi:predicted esterase